MKETKTLGIFTGYFECFVFLFVLLQPIKCIICRSKKTAPGFTGYEDLSVQQMPALSLFFCLPKSSLPTMYEHNY